MAGDVGWIGGNAVSSDRVVGRHQYQGAAAVGDPRQTEGQQLVDRPVEQPEGARGAEDPVARVAGVDHLVR